MTLGMKTKRRMKMMTNQKTMEVIERAALMRYAKMPRESANAIACILFSN
jgi:hypothetical protein